MSKNSYLGIVLGTLALLAGCGPAPGPDASSGQPLFVYVSPDPLGVNPFLIMGQQGVEQAARRHNARFMLLESEDPTTREENVFAAVDDGARLVVVLGFEFHDVVAKIALEAPDVDFLIIDQCVENKPPNVHCAVFREFEASFVLGAAAALLSESGHVGVLGTADIPFLHRYTEGFRAGAEFVDESIEVSVRWVGGDNPFSDPVRAKEQALAMAAGGTDYIFAAAAAGNYGVFEAAEESGFRVFGLDVDQCPDAPGRVVDNLLKHVDLVVAEAVDEILAGRAVPLMDYGLESGGLGTVALEENPSPESECLILDHPEVVDQLRDIARRVAAGEIGIADPMGIL